MSYQANLIVPIEMVNRGISSTRGSATTFGRSAIYFNIANYDGSPTVALEIIASNGHASTDYDVTLRDVTNSSDKVAITVTHGDSVKRLRSSAFSPAAGNNLYEITMPSTEADNNVIVYVARLIVTQTNATKTRVQIPLMGYAYNGYNKTDVGYYTDYVQGATYTQTGAQYNSMWTRTASNWGTVDSYDFECVMETNSASYAAYATLYNVTDAAAVASSELSTTSTTWSVQTANFTSDANFDDGDTFACYMKNASASYQCQVASASLYLNISDLSKGEVYWRSSRCGGNGSTAANNLIYSRVKLDTDSYSSPVCYHEAVVVEATSAEAGIELRDHTTNDYGSSGATTVTNSALTCPTTKGVVRGASALTGLTSGNRIFCRENATTYTLIISSSAIVVQFTGTVGIAAPVLVATQVGDDIQVSWS